jgi:hypothetical protein
VSGGRVGKNAAVPDNPETAIDTNVPNAARVYDYLLGGVTNFEIDRQIAERNNAVLPGGIDSARAEVRANRAFLVRAVRYLAAEAGIRQFLDIGTGIPTGDHVHSVAQDAAPESRIVYVDYDPIVLAHAHSLLTSSPEGATAYVHGDLREPDDILEQAAETLDLSQPVAVILVGILYLIGDGDDPFGIVAKLMDAVPSGSYLVLSHMTKDINTEAMEQLAELLNKTMPEPFVMRSHAEVSRFFDGLEPVEPGLVQVAQWRPTEGTPGPTEQLTAYYAGIARKP